MLRFVVLASCVLFAAACRYSLEDGASGNVDGGIDAPPSASCLEATQHSDLPWIEENVFKRSCIFSGCHNGTNTDAGQMDLRPSGSPATGSAPAAVGGPGRTAMHLVNVDSNLEPTFKVVVPNQPKQSYLMFMIQHIKGPDMDPPAPVPFKDGKMVPLMPQNAGGKPICIEKRQAIERWILRGAPAS